MISIKNAVLENTKRIDKVEKDIKGYEEVAKFNNNAINKRLKELNTCQVITLGGAIVAILGSATLIAITFMPKTGNAGGAKRFKF